MPVIILLETASIIDSVLHPSGTTLKDVLTQGTKHIFAPGFLASLICLSLGLF